MKCDLKNNRKLAKYKRMQEDKKQLVLDAFDNKITPRPPVGFWFHFVHPERTDYRNDPSVIEQNIEGHRQFFKEFQPDFVKLMSDGFFIYPNDIFLRVKDVNEFNSMTPVGPNHEWITKQVDLVQKQRATFTYDVATFYNIFSPASAIRFMLDNNSPACNVTFADWIMENKEAVKHALDVLATDISTLATEIISKGGATGIYLSCQQIQDPRITKELYQEVVAPSEIKVLEAAKSLSNYNIIHICGYDSARNNLEWFVNYPVSGISWATTVEGVSLKEGKKLFGGRVVIGGFPNTTESILYKGTKEEIENETKRILQESGTVGVIVGSDCSIPYDIKIDNLKYVREAASQFK